MKEGDGISGLIEKLADEAHGRQEYFSERDVKQANDYLTHMSLKDEAGQMMSEMGLTIKDIRRLRTKDKKK